jgi:hypothetical protein
METTEKTKLYPSQVNTKTISCRISAKDYVFFLQDAISKGITLNDWLLMRIYSQSLGKASQIEENDALNEVYEYITKGYETEPTPEGILDVIMGLENTINSDKILMESLIKKYKGKSDPNLSNIKAQILTLAQTKIIHQKELKNFMSEVNDLLAELE